MKNSKSYDDFAGSIFDIEYPDKVEGEQDCDVLKNPLKTGCGFKEFEDLKESVGKLECFGKEQLSRYISLDFPDFDDYEVLCGTVVKCDKENENTSVVIAGNDGNTCKIYFKDENSAENQRFATVGTRALCLETGIRINVLVTGFDGNTCRGLDFRIGPVFGDSVWEFVNRENSCYYAHVSVVG